MTQPSMIPREARARIEHLLSRAPAVVLTGPRQVGKTTVAFEFARREGAAYLDLERPRDRAKLSDVEKYCERNADRLVVFDEIHRVPGLFEPIRGIIDRRRREGRRAGHFLFLGSASINLLRQSGETLAGSPHSERDAATLLDLTMLAHNQGQSFNASRLAGSLGLTGATVGRYLDLMVDLLLVRRLVSWRSNVGRRLIKAPKTYLRDSGICHALLGIETLDALLGHPVAGGSWEGFVIENILSGLPAHVACGYYRSAGGAEIDLLLDMGDGEIWAVDDVIEQLESVACRWTVEDGTPAAGLWTSRTRGLTLPCRRRQTGLPRCPVPKPLVAPCIGSQASRTRTTG